MEIIVFIVCLAASTVGGICGIGGGVIIKPVLDSLGLMSVATAGFLSACTVLSMSMVSVIRSRKQLFQGGKSATLLAGGAALGGILGKLIFDLLKAQVGQDAWIKLVQGILLGLLTLGTLIYTIKKQKIHTLHMDQPWASASVGLSLGLLSSFLGIGGGPFNLVALHYFFSMDTKTAAQNSLYVVLLSQTANLLLTLFSGKLPGFGWGMLALMAAGGVLGGLLGSQIHRQISSKNADILFLGLLGIILGICVYNGISAYALL